MMIDRSSIFHPSGAYSSTADGIVVWSDCLYDRRQHSPSFGERTFDINSYSRLDDLRAGRDSDRSNDHASRLAADLRPFRSGRHPLDDESGAYPVWRSAGAARPSDLSDCGTSDAPPAEC